MILFKSIFSGIFFPNKKESLHCDVIYESFCLSSESKKCKAVQEAWYNDQDPDAAVLEVLIAG